MSSIVEQSDSTGELLVTPAVSTANNPPPSVADANADDAAASRLASSGTKSASVAASTVDSSSVVPNIIITSATTSSSSSVGNSADEKVTKDGKKSSEADVNKTAGVDDSRPVVIAVFGSKNHVDAHKSVPGEYNASDENGTRGIRGPGRRLSGMKNSGASRLYTDGIKFVNHVNNVPVVQSRGFCLRTQEYRLLCMPVNMVRSLANIACFPVLWLAPPTRRVCTMPLVIADYILCKGLDIVETLFPCIAVPPSQMLRVTKQVVTDSICFCPRATKRGTIAVCSMERASGCTS